MILAPQPEIEPTPPTLEGDVLTPEPPGKSLYIGLDADPVFSWQNICTCQSLCLHAYSPEVHMPHFI